ncbi:hypothetical protein JKP88DRAFT_70196 [Tribonema minus]|uniref:Uncharacterized protein n=1 Tax=Tribonema minus TaxID=303371 RepID=A0A836CCJ8_9STRA|nr:hypothetical protein JKP88DRAFT_70196 [Tribonema minus]
MCQKLITSRGQRAASAATATVKTSTATMARAHYNHCQPRKEPAAHAMASGSRKRALCVSVEDALGGFFASIASQAPSSQTPAARKRQRTATTAHAATTAGAGASTAAFRSTALGHSVLEQASDSFALMVLALEAEKASASSERRTHQQQQTRAEAEAKEVAAAATTVYQPYHLAAATGAPMFVPCSA